jgi:hypothetical protein
MVRAVTASTSLHLIAFAQATVEQQLLLVPPDRKHRTQVGRALHRYRLYWKVDPGREQIDPSRGGLPAEALQVG